MKKTMLKEIVTKKIGLVDISTYKSYLHFLNYKIIEKYQGKRVALRLPSTFWPTKGKKPGFYKRQFLTHCPFTRSLAH